MRRYAATTWLVAPALVLAFAFYVSGAAFLAHVAVAHATSHEVGEWFADDAGDSSPDTGTPVSDHPAPDDEQGCDLCHMLTGIAAENPAPEPPVVLPLPRNETAPALHQAFISRSDAALPSPRGPPIHFS